MMLRQLSDRLGNQLTQVPLAVQIVRTGCRVFELERAVVIVPVSLDRLEQHERVP